MNSPADGPAKGSNLNVTLLKQIIAQGPEGNAVPLFRNVALSIPPKKQGSGDVASMIIAGLMTPANVPGPYGTYVSDAGGQVRTCEGGMICRVRFGHSLPIDANGLVRFDQQRTWAELWNQRDGPGADTARPCW